MFPPEIVTKIALLQSLYPPLSRRPAKLTQTHQHVQTHPRAVKLCAIEFVMLRVNDVFVGCVPATGMGATNFSDTSGHRTGIQLPASASKATLDLPCEIYGLYYII